MQGKLTTANHGRIPKHAVARVSLIQQTGADGQQRIVAERTLHNIGTSPVAFDIYIGRALLNGPGAYGISAQIADANGNVHWQTPVPQSVQPLQDSSRPIYLVLQHNDLAGARAKKHYRCNDGSNC